MEQLLKDLLDRRQISITNRRIDLKHLLSAERAARGSFYATRVGFVAINPKGQRFARSHNGFPIGITETRERWSKAQKDFYHLHAECAGIFHALRHGYACKDATAYVTHPPCPGCMRALIGAGFKRVMFTEQAYLERHDWRDDMHTSFDIARQHQLGISIYRDKERSMKHADITRTEVELKKVYDQLVPQARWSSRDASEISKPTKPESGDWVEQPVVKRLLSCAVNGAALYGKGIVMDQPPECRAATAIIQAGIKEIIICEDQVHKADARWCVPLELQRAKDMLQQEAHIVMHTMPSRDVEQRVMQSEVGEFLNTSSVVRLSHKHLA